MKKIREDHGDASAVPEIDTNNGNDDAKYMILLEAPGAKEGWQTNVKNSPETLPTY